MKNEIVKLYTFETIYIQQSDSYSTNSQIDKWVCSVIIEKNWEICSIEPIEETGDLYALSGRPFQNEKKWFEVNNYRSYFRASWK